MGVVHCLASREDWITKRPVKMKYLLCLSLLLFIHQILAGPVAPQEGNQLPRTGRTFSGNSTEDIFNDLSRLLQGTAALLKTIVETKKATVLPLIETAIETKKALIESDVIKGTIKAKAGVVATLTETGPEIGKTIGGVIGTVADVAPAIIKAGVCGLACPLLGEQCVKDHCGGDATNTDVTVQP